MIAIDTNVIVRGVTADDPEQTERVLALLQSGEDLFVATTVLLEAEWVLRKSYQLGARGAPEVIEAFVALPQVQLEHPKRVLAALRRAREGFDFADALHHAAAAEAGCESFATFDIALASRSIDRQTSVKLL